MTGIGIDIGATYTKIVAMREGGKVLKQMRLPTEPRNGPDAFIKKISGHLNNWKLEFGKTLRSIGIGVAGDIDPQKGIIRFSPNLNRWRNVPVVKPLKRKTGLPCVMENDADMAAWGAYVLELKKKYKNVIAVTLGTGIGGGIVLEGRLYHGSTGSAGEIGHAKINWDSSAEICACGDRGCLEAYIGSYAISRKVVQVLKTIPKNSILARLCTDEKRVSTRRLTEAADEGDPVARRIWLETGQYLGRGLANVGQLFNPDCIVLTGGVSRAWRHFLPALKKVLSEQSMAVSCKFMKIVVAKNADLGSLGAALYGLERNH